MLRNVLIMASSGIMLFSKEYTNTISQPRLIGSLMTAMLEFSAKVTGSPVSYIKFAKVAVTVVSNEAAKVFCAMFHDPSDGATFSSFIANEILEAFILEFAAELGNVGHNVRQFDRFHLRIVGIIRHSIQRLLKQLQQQRGILKAIFVADGSIIHATAEVDQIGVLANLQVLVNASLDMMAAVNNTVNSVTIQSSRSTCTEVIHVVDDGTLIVVHRKSVSATKHTLAIQECVDMLRKVCGLLRHLHRTTR
ncbi:hypothetical protein ABG067_002096 [Albugo candida]